VKGVGQNLCLKCGVVVLIVCFGGVIWNLVAAERWLLVTSVFLFPFCAPIIGWMYGPTLGAGFYGGFLILCLGWFSSSRNVLQEID
jgi:hypothetical protein